jgi:hypothetical protein
VDPPPVDTEVLVLELLLMNLDTWDVKHGILLGLETTNDFHNFRWLLHDVLEDLRAGKVDESNYAAVRRKVHQGGMQLELGLRSDIGVYGLGISQKEKALAMTRRTSWYERRRPSYPQRFTGWFQGSLRHEHKARRQPEAVHRTIARRPRSECTCGTFKIRLSGSSCRRAGDSYAKAATATGL